MKPPPFRYHAPRSKQEALGLLSSLENSRLLAGGQSLMPMLNFRLLAPDHLIDINWVTELRGIDAADGTLRVGAATRQCDLEFSADVRKHAPLIQAALAHVGHRPTRNRGTLGGSLCHLDPSAELVTAAAALEATLVAESSRGTRRIPFSAWSAGYLTNALEPDELLVRVDVPIWPHRHGCAFAEYARRKGDFAIVGVAALVTLRDDGRIDRAALALGGCAASPQRLTAVEAQIAGERPDVETIKGAARLAAAVDAISDPYVSGDYRRHLARVMTERALAEAVRRAASGGSA